VTVYVQVQDKKGVLIYNPQFNTHGRFGPKERFTGKQHKATDRHIE